MYGKKKINLQSKDEVHSAITNIINDQFDNELNYKKEEIQQINDNLKIVGNLIQTYQNQYDQQIQEVKSSSKIPFDSINLFQAKATPLYFQTAENEFVQINNKIRLICKECEKYEFQSEVGFLAHMKEIHNINYTLENAIELSSQSLDPDKLPPELKSIIDETKNNEEEDDDKDTSKYPKFFTINSSSLSPNNNNNNKTDKNIKKDNNKDKNKNKDNKDNNKESNEQSPKSLKRKSIRNSPEKKGGKFPDNKEDSNKRRKINDDDDDDEDNEDDKTKDSNSINVGKVSIKTEHKNNTSVNNINKNKKENNSSDKNNNNGNNGSDDININVKEETSEEMLQRKKEELERKKERWKERHSAFLLSKGIILQPPKITQSDDLMRPSKDPNLKTFITKRIIIGNTSKFVPKKLRELDDDTTHKWMIYVRGPEEEPDLSHFVKKVRFFLHPSFAPNDIVDVIHSPFRIVRRGWGEFPVLIQIYFLANIHPPVDYTHHLKLDKSCSGQPLLGSESPIELVFEPAFFSDIYKLQQQQISITNSLLKNHASNKKDDDDDDE